MVLNVLYIFYLILWFYWAFLQEGQIFHTKKVFDKLGNTQIDKQKNIQSDSKMKVASSCAKNDKNIFEMLLKKTCKKAM